MSQPEQPPINPESGPAQNAQPATAVHIHQALSERRGGCGFVAGALGCLAVLAAMIIVPVLAGVAPVIAIINVIGSILSGGSVGPASAQTITSQTILTGIQPLGQLVTIGAQFAKADIVVGVREGRLNVCGHSASYVAQGSVQAGVDLLRIGPEDISYDAVADRYTLRLPAPQITSCSLDMIDQYTQTATACNPDYDALRQIAGYTALTEFATDAVEGGLLERARREAQITLSSFIRALTGSDVVITFADQQPPAQAESMAEATAEAQAGPPRPASCQPRQPPGWTYDPVSGQWSRG